MASDDTKTKLGAEMKSYREMVLGRLESLKDDGILRLYEYDNLRESFRNIERYLLKKDKKVKEVSDMGDNVKPWSEELRDEGRLEGENKLARLMNKLMVSGRNDDALKATIDEQYRQILYTEFGITD